MSRRALAGGYGPAQSDGKKRPKRKPSQTPLEFALAFMRDETQTPALRAAMAKAALPYLHTRGEAPEDDDAPAEEPMSDLELARRIAHILERGRMEQEKLAESRSSSLSPPDVGLARHPFYSAQVGQARLALGRGCPPEPEGRRRAGEGVQHSRIVPPHPPHAQVEFTRLGPSEKPISGKPEIGRSAPSPRKRGEGTQDTAPPRALSANAPPVPRPRDTAPTQRTAWPDDDAAQSRDIYPDPHAGYRWIP